MSFILIHLAKSGPGLNCIIILTTVKTALPDYNIVLLMPLWLGMCQHYHDAPHFSNIYNLAVKSALAWKLVKQKPVSTNLYLRKLTILFQWECFH